MRPPSSGLPHLGPASKLTTLDYAPIVVTRPPAILTDDDVELIITAFDTLYDAEFHFASVLDARSMQAAPTPRQRKRLTDWAEQANPRTRKFGVCTSYVVTSAVIRASLTAIGWIFEYPTPTKYVATIGEACDFAVKHLSGRGLALPRNLDALRKLPPP